MSLTCQSYLDELVELGVPDIETASAIKIINLARNEIVTAKSWSFRLTTTAEATPPTTITDLGTIVSVVDSANNAVPPVTKGALEKAGYDLTSTATYPDYFYQSSHQVITTYPIAAVSIEYLALPTFFTATSSTEDLLPDDCIMAVAYRAAMHANLRVGVADLAREFGKLSAEA
ncbi:MAG: hypothetical protein RL272_803, partial [Candidatus Parcubacteria bacterium]